MPSVLSRKVKMMMVVVSTLLILIASGEPLAAAPDTTWSVTFSVNMSKAVKDNVFHPATDSLYVLLDHGVLPFRLVPGPGYVYTGTMYNTLDTTLTYHYKFRINQSTWETIIRTFTPQPGMVNISVWWNDIAMNYTTFMVNMKQAWLNGWFNPATDSVMITGTMNNWKISPKMSRVGVSWNYSYVYSLDPGTVQHYKYRINEGDSTLGHYELIWKPNRMIRIPDTLLQLADDYNNQNPGKRLMTFKCNMAYYVKTHRFSIAGNFVNVAGNFNNNGANDVLFRTGTDTVYALDKYIDTSYFHSGPLTFKFRIDGLQSAAELTGKPNRTYAFHDTINLNPNIYSCYYNNLDPSVPMRPWAYDLAIQGNLIHLQIVTGSYSYEDVNGIREDSSTYRWYRSFDALGDSVASIDTGKYISYVVDTLDIGKWLVFEVTPRAARGDSAVGRPVRIVSVTPVGGVGIDERSALLSKLYPNPATGFITVEAKREISRIEIVDLNGRTVLVAAGLQTRAIRLSLAHLAAGSYLLNASTKSGEHGVVHLVRD